MGDRTHAGRRFTPIGDHRGPRAERQDPSGGVGATAGRNGFDNGATPARGANVIIIAFGIRTGLSRTRSVRIE